jgi:hypothetical protein
MVTKEIGIAESVAPTHNSKLVTHKFKGSALPHLEDSHGISRAEPFG